MIFWTKKGKLKDAIGKDKTDMSKLPQKFVYEYDRV